MNKKITLVAISSVSILSLFAGGAFVSAQNSPSTPQMILQVGPKGNVLMRGTIDSMTSSTLMVKSWGGDWTINVNQSTTVNPSSAGNDLGKFQKGDSVEIHGTVSQNSSWTIDAASLRDLTLTREVNDEEKENRGSVKELIHSEMPRSFQGTVSNVSTSSFTLATHKGPAYSVNVAVNAKIVERNWLTIGLADIQNGDTVRVWGVRASSTITASVVRDISLPSKKR